MVEPSVLRCTSYRADALRVKRLHESRARHDPEQLPVVIAIPEAELPLFREIAAGHAAPLVGDENIVRSHPPPGRLSRPVRALPRGAGQPVAAGREGRGRRLLGCERCLRMDPDTVFLRDAHRSDVLTPAGHPYTLRRLSHELLQLAVNRGRGEVLSNFHTGANA